MKISNAEKKAFIRDLLDHVQSLVDSVIDSGAPADPFRLCHEAISFIESGMSQQASESQLKPDEVKALAEMILGILQQPNADAESPPTAASRVTPIRKSKQTH